MLFTWVGPTFNVVPKNEIEVVVWTQLLWSGQVWAPLAPIRSKNMATVHGRSLLRRLLDPMGPAKPGLRICNRSGVGAECAFVLPPARAVVESAFAAPARAELLLP